MRDNSPIPTPGGEQIAQIKSIVYQPLDQNYTDGRFDYFIRVPAQEITLKKDHGIEGDAKAGRQSKRQLNLITTDWLEARQSDGYKTGPGEFGEQIILDGIAYSEFKKGMRLQIGGQAVIELTKPRTGCTRLEEAQGKPLSAEIKKGIGWLACVLESGKIRVGDEVKILELAN